MTEIGQKVRSRRKEMQLTQSELAKQSKLSRATINALENGMLAELGMSRLTMLLEVLGLTLFIGPNQTRRPTLDELYERQATQRAGKTTGYYRG